VQLLNLGIRAGALELLGGLRNLVFDGLAPLRRVVGHGNIVAGRIDDGRERLVLGGGPLDGLAAGRLEAGAHGGVDARIIKRQRDVAVGVGDDLCRRRTSSRGGRHHAEQDTVAGQRPAGGRRKRA